MTIRSKERKKKNREISFPPNEIFIRLDAITATSNFCFTIVVLRVLRYTGGIKSRRGERNFARGMDSKSVKRQSRRSSPGSACLPACLPGHEGTPVGLRNFFSSAFYGYARALIMHMLNIKRSPRVFFV